MNLGAGLAIAGLVGVAYAGAAGADDRSGESCRFDPGDPFERIDVRGGATINVARTAEGEHARIAVAATDDVLARVCVHVSDGTLFVETDDKDIAAEDLTIDLAVPTLAEIVNSGSIKLNSVGLRATSLVVEDRGAGDYRFEDLAVDELLLEARGAVRVRIDGEATRQIVDIAGAGSYEAAELRTRTAEISLKGAAQANVHAAERLDVRIAGAGIVQYAGDPQIRQRILGAGLVRKLADTDS